MGGVVSMVKAVVTVAPAFPTESMAYTAQRACMETVLAGEPRNLGHFIGHNNKGQGGGLAEGAGQQRVAGAPANT